jgi:hypothetical protein
MREVMIIQVLKAGEERLPRCITDEEEFQAGREQKECKRKQRIEAEDYVA